MSPFLLSLRLQGVDPIVVSIQIEKEIVMKALLSNSRKRCWS
jgi:hypothetical protein